MAFIVTGASSGIGFAVATALANQDQHVIASARSAEHLERLQASSPDRIHIIPADLSTTTGRDALISAAEQLDNIAGLVHAAGSRVSPASYHALEVDKLNSDFNIHVATPISLNNALHNKLTNARIVFIDSYSASTVRVGWSGYSIVKAAAQMAARAAVEEMRGPQIIRVFPGAVQTPLVNAVLTSKKATPTVDLFKEVENNGQLLQPAVVGEFIANILLKATDEQLNKRDTWDINNSDDQIF